MRWRLLMVILWPAFLAAAAGCGLIFALVDPLDVPLLGRWQPGRIGFYTVSFFVLWLIAALSSALTAWMAPRAAPDTEGPSF
ncbi:hypothetical protein [Bordetella sp. BOR01]|uniref:hypothetical protein n=1 Tax=Bordetella sp. BOR01 TaxID=2854779 RepID=UPI001C480E4E|nr:hypothetical protein [Bordetella sp. BOR01]MBV7486892.1 hypothetical protein [Bordetella sp. BOR01]